MGTRMRAKVLAGVAAVLLSVTVWADPALAARHHEPALQDEVDAVVEAGAAGVLVRVDDHGRVSEFRAGAADLETGRPMPWASRVMIASLTKPFVAGVVLQLVDEGLVDLDDSLERWLPGVLPEMDTDAITVRHLLQMRAGIPDYLGRAGVLQQGPRELAEIVALVRDARPLFEPGARHYYGNINYVLLGLIIERATGSTVAEQLQERILGPLRLRHTLPPIYGDLPRPHPVAYRANADGTHTEVTLYNPTVAATAGGMVSTTRDVLAYHRALLSGRVLPPELLAEMLRTADGYGLGIREMALSCGLTVYGHSGSITGYGTEVWSSRDGRRQAVVAMNTSPAGGMRPAAIVAVDRFFCG